MSGEELRDLFTEAVGIVQAEKKWRRKVFHDPITQKAKVGEMERVLAILVLFKDELKPHVSAIPEQGTLIDVPRKYE